MAGVLAVVVALSAAPQQTAQAHDCVGLDGFRKEPGANPCTGRTALTTMRTATATATGMATANGDGMGDGFMHATMPMYFWLEGLDNGARLNWEAPGMVAEHAMVVGYQIDRDAWNAMASHPINMYGGATIMVYAHETSHSDLGLAYETVYTYMVRAKVHYNVEGWWNMLDCVEMNDAVTPTGDEPAVGANTDGTTYCKMYDDLSAEAMVVVQRAYAALDPMAYTYYGEWSMKRTTETADSGGRLAALLDPPTMVQDIDAIAACANIVTVSWQAPSYLGHHSGDEPANGVYVGPDYIGADDAGREEVGDRRHERQLPGPADGQQWPLGYGRTHVDMMYTDSDVDYDNTYKYRVRAMNSHGLYGPWAMVTEDLTEPDEPNMPRSLNVDPVNGTVELQWDAPEDSSDDPLWRMLVDFNRAGDASGNLSYIIERKVGGGSWARVRNPDKPNPQPHKYADNFDDTLTQAYTDDNPPVGEVSYRVAALVHGCNPSPYNQKDPVTVVEQPLGNASGLSAVSSAAGTVALTWTPGVSSSVHWVAGIGENADGSYDSSRTVWTQSAAQNTHTVANLASGNYRFAVIAGESVNGPWSIWTLSNMVTVQ